MNQNSLHWISFICDIDTQCGCRLWTTLVAKGLIKYVTRITLFTKIYRALHIEIGRLDLRYIEQIEKFRLFTQFDLV